MASNTNQLHFILIPLMAQGHLIPVVDMAKILAQRGVVVTIVTTPFNATRISPMIDRGIKSGLPIRLLQLRLPSVEAGLPEGCESADTLPSRAFIKNFMVANSMLQEPLEQVLEELSPSPSCIISDKFMPWTNKIANKFCIPRLVFDGMNCFTRLCTHNLLVSKVYESVPESETFVVPGLPDRVELTRAQLPGDFNPGEEMKDIREEIRAIDEAAYGVVVNSFEELETSYVEEYKGIRSNKVWCIGPVSLCNKENVDKADRGNKASIDEQQCLKWLETKAATSVVYACLGSLSRLTPSQLMEFGLGLELSNRPFVWVIRGGDKTEELEELILENGFEERIKGRGLLIRGWAPQVLILSHPAVGAFLTHCGWNSTLEGICKGLPMIACPLFGDQFFNEKLIVEILGIGVGVGAKAAVYWGEEEKTGLVVRREEVRKAVEKVMDEGKEGEEIRRKAIEFGEMANRAMEEGGSSCLNVTLLIEDIKQLSIKKQSQ